MVKSKRKIRANIPDYELKLHKPHPDTNTIEPFLAYSKTVFQISRWIWDIYWVCLNWGLTHTSSTHFSRSLTFLSHHISHHTVTSLCCVNQGVACHQHRTSDAAVMACIFRAGEFGAAQILTHGAKGWTQQFVYLLESTGGIWGANKCYHIRLRDRGFGQRVQWGSIFPLWPKTGRRG